LPLAFDYAIIDAASFQLIFRQRQLITPPLRFMPLADATPADIAMPPCFRYYCHYFAFRFFIFFSLMMLLSPCRRHAPGAAAAISLPFFAITPFSLPPADIAVSPRHFR